ELASTGFPPLMASRRPHRPMISAISMGKARGPTGSYANGASMSQPAHVMSAARTRAAMPRVRSFMINIQESECRARLRDTRYCAAARKKAATAACGLLLDQAETVGQFVVGLYALFDVRIEFRARFVEREQALLLAQLGVLGRGHRFVEGINPELVGFVRNLRAYVEPADDGPFDVVALFLGGGHRAQLAGQALAIEHRQHTNRGAAFQHSEGFGGIPHVGLDVAAAQGRHGFAAALERHKAHFAEINT